MDNQDRSSEESKKSQLVSNFMLFNTAINNGFHKLSSRGVMPWISTPMPAEPMLVGPEISSLSGVNALSTMLSSIPSGVSQGASNESPFFVTLDTLSMLPKEGLNNIQIGHVRPGGLTSFILRAESQSPGSPISGLLGKTSDAGISPVAPINSALFKKGLSNLVERNYLNVVGDIDRMFNQLGVISYEDGFATNYEYYPFSNVLIKPPVAHVRSQSDPKLRSIIEMQLEALYFAFRVNNGSLTDKAMELFMSQRHEKAVPLDNSLKIELSFFKASIVRDLGLFSHQDLKSPPLDLDEDHDIDVLESHNGVVVAAVTQAQDDLHEIKSLLPSYLSELLSEKADLVVSVARTLNNSITAAICNQRSIHLDSERFSVVSEDPPKITGLPFEKSGSNPSPF